MAWAVVSENAVHRITFSKALADHAVQSSGRPYAVKRIKLELGRELGKGNTSSSGAYAIVDKNKGKILRVALNQEIAEILAADYKSRKVVEAYLQKCA